MSLKLNARLSAARVWTALHTVPFCVCCQLFPFKYSHKYILLLNKIFGILFLVLLQRCLPVFSLSSIKLLTKLHSWVYYIHCSQFEK